MSQSIPMQTGMLCMLRKLMSPISLDADPLSGYLNAHWIANVAVTAGCDGVHPGYGFLSENSNFAAICKKRGLNFIGPEL